MLYRHIVTDIRTRFKPYLDSCAAVIRRCAGIAIYCAGLLATTHADDGIDTLPDLGSSSSSMISAAEEARVGAAFIRQARRQLDFIDDPELLYYLNGVGQNLVEAARTDIDFHFYLINDPSLNAFAVPGGHIAVHTGLISMAESEAELASVLSHEIAHVTQHHIARGLEKSRFQGVTALAAMLAAVALGGGDAAQAALIAAQAASVDAQLRFSRDFEREADSLGIRTLSKAGYDPNAMPAFFSTMQQWSRIRESGTPEYLRSHPLTVNRVAESAARAANLPAAAPRDESRFLRAQAKIDALFSKDERATVKLFAADVSEDSENVDPAVRYGYALALSRTNQFDAARAQFTALIDADPENWSYQLGLADNELEDQNYKEGLAILRELRNSFPDLQSEARGVVDLYYMNALVLTEHYKEALPLLRYAIRKNPEEPLFHIMVAKVYGETGEILRAYQSRGEYHYLVGNLGFALQQYQHALPMASTYYDRESISARIEDIKRDLEELRSLGASGFSAYTVPSPLH